MSGLTRNAMVVAGLVTLLATRPAEAAPVFIIGGSTGGQSTATLDSTFDGTTLTVTVTNTSPFDARITAIAYDLPPRGNDSDSGLDGFAGTITTDFSNFVFTDAELGNIPQVNDAVADFGFITSNNGSFAGGSPNDGLAPGESETYSVTGPFGSLTQAQVINAVGVRFQRVGIDGEGSDVGGPGGTPFEEPPVIPEPASLVLMGLGLTGVVGLKARRKRQAA